MVLKILGEKNNLLFKRKEIKAAIESETTPKREEILESLSKKFSVSPQNIKITKITGNFGVKDFTIEANIYSSKEEKDTVELKKKKEHEAEKKFVEANKPKEEEQKSEETKKEKETPGSEQIKEKQEQKPE